MLSAGALCELEEIAFESVLRIVFQKSCNVVLDLCIARIGAYRQDLRLSVVIKRCLA